MENAVRYIRILSLGHNCNNFIFDSKVSYVIVDFNTLQFENVEKMQKVQNCSF